MDEAEILADQTLVQFPDQLAEDEQGRVVKVRAEIAALHVTAPSAAETAWDHIVSIYDQLHAIDPSPVVELARAVAVWRAEGAVAGLAALPELGGNPYAHAAKAAFLAELGRRQEARSHLEQARALARTEPERRLMARHLADNGP